MMALPEKIDLETWDARHAGLRRAGLTEPWYGGPLGRHAADGDERLRALRFDNAPASLRLWNLVLTEEDRLQEHRDQGKRLVGAMKDLGAVPLLAFAAPELVCFYPDGAWWTPCIMECTDGLLNVADRLGIDDTFCPVRAMLGAFETQRHFPIPDLLTCSTGTACDDFTAIARTLERLGHPILWWEIPHRRAPGPGEEFVTLPTGFTAPRAQLTFVKAGLERLCAAFGELAGHPITTGGLHRSLLNANRVRALAEELWRLVACATPCPLPALEMLLVDVLPVHFCSDPAETQATLQELVAEVRRRVAAGAGVLAPDAVGVYWVNPVADLRVMNLVEEYGARIVGADFMFAHARAEVPVDIEPLEAVAQIALGDPMAGTAQDRARRIGREIARCRAEGLVVSRIPGASHCASEGGVIRDEIARRFPHLPVTEIEVPPVADACFPTLRTRIEAVVEIARERRNHALRRH